RFSRYRVTEMRGEDAIKAVLEPAKKILNDPEVAKEIIKKLPPPRFAEYNPHESGGESWKSKRIEPFILSLFCYQANERRWRKRDDFLTMELVREMDARNLLHEFYMEKTKNLDHVRTVVEDLLVTDEGYKKWLDRESLAARNVTGDEIDKLVDSRILRKDTRGEVEYVELIHDVLAEILAERRTERKDKEKKQEEERLREIEADKKKRKNRRIIAALSILVFVIFSASIAWTIYQKNITQKETERANLEAKRAEDAERVKQSIQLAFQSMDVQKKVPKLSFSLAEAGYKNKDRNQFTRKAVLSAFYSAEFYDKLRQNMWGVFDSEQTFYWTAFSSDEKKIVTITSREAKLWNWNRSENKITGDKVQLPKENLLFFKHVAFSPNGKTILLGTNNPQTLLIWDLDKDMLNRMQLEYKVKTAVFYRFGKRKHTCILTANSDNKVRILDLSGNVLRTSEKHDDIDFAIASTKGKYIASGSRDNTVRLWEPEKNKILKTFSYKKSPIVTASFSRDGRLFLTAARDGGVQLWDITKKDGRIVNLNSDEIKSSEIRIAAFAPDGKYILTVGSKDKMVRLWSIENNYPLIEFTEFKEDVHTLSFSPPGGGYILIAPQKSPAQLRPVDPDVIMDIVKGKFDALPLIKE
ncbi:MAG: hypothetical protein GY757_54025, partial [bacterium]|nr:hypothetical protein [bacterium]